LAFSELVRPRFSPDISLKCLSRRLTIEECAFAVDAPLISAERTVLSYDAMARDADVLPVKISVVAGLIC
jgi:hypothetical protein